MVFAAVIVWRKTKDLIDIPVIDERGALSTWLFNHPALVYVIAQPGELTATSEARRTRSAIIRAFAIVLQTHCSANVTALPFDPKHNLGAVGTVLTLQILAGLRMSSASAAVMVSLDAITTI
jgi:hypothetical protein